MAELDDEGTAPLLNPPRLQRENSSPIVEEPDAEPPVPNTNALLHESTATISRDVIVSRPPPAPSATTAVRPTRAPLQGVLRQPSNLMNSETRRGSVEYSASSSSARLRFDNSILQQPANSNHLLPRQTVLGRGNGNASVGLNDVDAPFSDHLEPDYSTPEWTNATVTERSRLTPNASNSGAGYYQSLPSANTSNGSNGGPEGYEDEAYDDDDPIYIKSVYMLSCSILFITSVVFVIVVSGLTTLYSRRNMPRFEIRSDWPRDGFIPDKYGCNAPGGMAMSIPIEWQNVPKKATNLVVLFANADSVDVHWLVTDIPLEDTSGRHVFKLPANASENSALMPAQAKQRPNMHLKNGHYFPPCPKHNTTNMFVLHAYAIEAEARIGGIKEARQIMNGFVGVPSARYSGKYGGSSRYGGDGSSGADSHNHGKNKHQEVGHSTHNPESSSHLDGHHGRSIHDPELTQHQDLVDEKHESADAGAYVHRQQDVPHQL